MDHALVLISVFAVFIPALILPGPDFVAVVRSSMTRGTRAGLRGNGAMFMLGRNYDDPECASKHKCRDQYPHAASLQAV